MKNMRLRTPRGFTLIELLVVVGIVFALVAVVFGGYAICTSNAWFRDESVLRELKVHDPAVREVSLTTRNVLSRSVITATLEDGATKEYYLDTNILGNYTFSSR